MLEFFERGKKEIVSLVSLCVHQLTVDFGVMVDSESAVPKSHEATQGGWFGDEALLLH